MEKNIIVTDKSGNQIGSTYPKRAKGLVKNGRAEFIDDRTIRLLTPHVPTVIQNNEFTEDKNMSKVINFNAKDFRIDKAFHSTSGCRVFESTPRGNVQIFEIEGGAKINAFKTLEKNTDYVFRFAIVCDIEGEHLVSRAVISNGEPEDNLIFPLEQSRFQPIISKRHGAGLLRVFDLPFNTGDFEDWQFSIKIHNSNARIYPVFDLSDYDELEDLTYEQWKNEQFHFHSQTSRSDKSERPDEGLSRLDDFIEDIVKNTIPNALSKANAVIGNDDEDDDEDDDVDDDEDDDDDDNEMTEREFAKLLKNSHGNIELVNAEIYSDGSNEQYDIGNTLVGAKIKLPNADMTSRAFSMLIAKIGKGCIIDAHNLDVSDEGMDAMYENAGDPATGAIIDMHNPDMNSKAFSLLVSKLGAGCVLDLHNIDVSDEGIDDMYDVGEKISGAAVDLHNSDLPEKALQLLKSKLGMVCYLDTHNTDTF